MRREAEGEEKKNHSHIGTIEATTELTENIKNQDLWRSRTADIYQHGT